MRKRIKLFQRLAVITLKGVSIFNDVGTSNDHLIGRFIFLTHSVIDLAIHPLISPFHPEGIMGNDYKNCIWNFRKTIFLFGHPKTGCPKMHLITSSMHAKSQKKCNSIHFQAIIFIFMGSSIFCSFIMRRIIYYVYTYNI